MIQCQRCCLSMLESGAENTSSLFCKYKENFEFFKKNLPFKKNYKYEKTDVAFQSSTFDQTKELFTRKKFIC